MCCGVSRAEKAFTLCVGTLAAKLWRSHHVLKVVESNAIKAELRLKDMNSYGCQTFVGEVGAESHTE